MLRMLSIAGISLRDRRVLRRGRKRIGQRIGGIRLVGSGISLLRSCWRDRIKEQIEIRWRRSTGIIRI